MFITWQIDSKEKGKVTKHLKLEEEKTNKQNNHIIKQIVLLCSAQNVKLNIIGG